MDDTGNIYRFCNKCGDRVEYDRDCPKCGDESTVAQDLANQLEGMVKDEVPDPFGKMGELLRREHRRMQRKGR